ncbi:hypothetical protein [Xylocopilactobacillus apicola]|uniref:DUF5082 domain-containing protein n=1 Tax=Xylocopilactobacillus apicola TaxID=2932184 RepID=A0AAU9DQG1_9LACO|nr:hypothetical protein [Xylocopilactobacillus apicola]BDR59427.1 hypothetical protein XA3_18680 [Xylocopilactobacillus apicola]
MEVKKQDEFEKYDQMIQTNNDSLDKLRADRRKFEESNDDLFESIHQSFQRLRYLNDENIHFGNSANRRWQSQNDEQEMSFKRRLKNSATNVLEAYDSEVKSIENENDELYRLRKGKQWD